MLVALLRSVLPVSVVEAIDADVPTVRMFAVNPLLKVLSWLKVLVLARSVEEAAKTVMSAVPLKATPLMLRDVWSAVAVEALPVSEPIIPPLAFRVPLTLSTEPIVEEPLTKSAVVVAPANVAPPLNASCVVVALPMNG